MISGEAGRGRDKCRCQHFAQETVPTSASKSSIQRFVITEKAPTRAFSWLKAATTAFTFKTLLRHYAKRVLTPRSLNVKLGPRRNYHKGRAAIRHNANHPVLYEWLLIVDSTSGNPAQVQDGADYRVLISPLPPIKEEAKEEVEAEEEVKTVVKEQRKVSIKKVVKVEVKSNGLDERWLSGVSLIETLWYI